MPYRRKPRSQRKYSGRGKVTEHILKKFTPRRRSLIKFGIVAESVKNPETHQPLTKKLASSSKTERDNAIAKVRHILHDSNSKMDKAKMSQLWKALFYSFWMSDKVLIQQELSRKLSNFIKICHSHTISLLYIESFMECIEREWSGIDYHRMNKFLSLIRYFIHSCFDYLALNEWNLDLIKQFTNILINKIDLLNNSNRGLFLHLCDIYIEELVKINRIDSDTHLRLSYRMPIAFDALYQFLVPFIRVYLQSNRMWQSQYVIRQIFNKLMESMTFDSEMRENALTAPGKDNLDLYKFNINKGCDILEQNSKNPKKNRKKEESHLMFDKKNFDVIMPFKEFETDADKQRVMEWETKYESVTAKRNNDPLLLKEKLEKFKNVFEYLASEENTPKKSKKKLRVLARVFELKEGIGFERNYDREAVKQTLKLVDDRKKLWKFRQMTGRRKKRMRRVMKHQMKWRKMNKKSRKIKPTKLLLKRASNMIV